MNYPLLSHEISGRMVRVEFRLMVGCKNAGLSVICNCVWKSHKL